MTSTDSHVQFFPVYNQKCHEVAFYSKVFIYKTDFMSNLIHGGGDKSVVAAQWEPLPTGGSLNALYKPMPQLAKTIVCQWKFDIFPC